MTEKKNMQQVVYRRFMPALAVGIICGLLVIALSFQGFSRRAELKAIDFRFHLRSSLQKAGQDHRIVIIAIDRKTSDELGMKSENRPMIFWIPYYSAITSKLLEGGAGVVAFDIIPQISTDEYFANLFGELKRELVQKGVLRNGVSFEEWIPQWDRELAQVISEQNVVFASFIDDRTKSWQRPIDQIFFALDEQDFPPVNLVNGADGFVRSVMVSLDDLDRKDHLCFPFRVVSKYLHEKPEVNAENEFSIGSNRVVTDNNSSMMINFRGREGTFTTIPFSEVLRKARGGDREYFKKNFSGRIVLVGTTDPSQLDIKRTPFGTMPGVEVHANAINTILQKDYLKGSPLWLNCAIILVLCLLVAGICFGLTGLPGIIIAAAVPITWTALACYFFNCSNIVLPVAMPAAGSILAAGVTYIYRYSVEDSEKRRMRGLFERYVSAPVVNKIMEAPESLDLEGQYTEVSVLFSDINGFTTLSEQLYPHEVITILNEYFDLMIDIVFRHNGTLKQFVGDEIMAIYGAPYHYPDHALQAAATAVEMMEAVEGWKKRRENKGKRAFDIKIGLHTGKVVCGNVGSAKRTEYAAVGDVVNTGARIMALNSKVQSTTRILASRELYDAVQSAFTAHFIDNFPLKGKDAPVAVYEITGKKEV